MEIRKIAKIAGGQDGAVWKNFLFRFDHKGQCSVYDLKEIENSDGGEVKEFAAFVLDRADEVAPHSNAAMFGAEYFSPEDEFPLLYTNIYNNYANTDNPLKGVCLVYHLQRNGAEFFTSLVQIIEIGFVEDGGLWKSEEGDDIRPYGNFTIDAEKGIYYAFTMRDQSNTTRYFSFDLPKLGEGTEDERYNVNKVVLKQCDIKEVFDCEYHRFVQGACFHDGKIYSLEGFSESVENPPALRVIDIKTKKQIQFVNFVKSGLNIEPEMIDFANGNCYYSDNSGNLYVIDYE